MPRTSGTVKIFWLLPMLPSHFVHLVNMSIWAF